MSDIYESKKNYKRSISLNDISSYTRISVSEFFEQIQCDDELMIYYLDYIRNYRCLLPDMLKKINNFSDENKMILINEFNKVLKDLTDYLSNK